MSLPEFVRRRCWSRAVTTAGLFPREVGDDVVFELKLHELRHTAASLAIQAMRTSRRFRTCSAAMSRRG